MKRRLLAVIMIVVGLEGALVFVPLVGAAPITRTYNFSATGFSVLGSGAVAPTDPVNGSVTITFDPTLTSLDFAVNAITLTIDAHTYTAAEVTADFFFSGSDDLLIGGALNGNDGLVPGTDDFAFVVAGAPTLNPTLGLFAYTSVGTAGTPDVFQTFGGSVILPAAVPEPSTWLLFATGLAGLLGYGRRRREP